MTMKLILLLTAVLAGLALSGLAAEKAEKESEKKPGAMG